MRIENAVRARVAGRSWLSGGGRQEFWVPVVVILLKDPKAR